MGEVFLENLGGSNRLIMALISERQQESKQEGGDVIMKKKKLEGCEKGVMSQRGLVAF